MPKQTEEAWYSEDREAGPDTAGKKAMEEGSVQPEQSLEELLGEIEAIIGQMQQREISLEDSFRLYQQGIGKLKICNEKIDAVEKKLQILTGDGVQ